MVTWRKPSVHGHGCPGRGFGNHSLRRSYVTYSTTIEEKARAILKYHFPVLTRKLRFTTEAAFFPASNEVTLLSSVAPEASKVQQEA